MGERTGSIRAADAPDRPPQVECTIDSATGGIWITWDSTSHDGSEVIDGFEIQIMEDIGFTWVLVETETAVTDPPVHDKQIELGWCNGTNATIMAEHACLVPMDIWVVVFNYDFRDFVYARVRAHNYYGWSDWSIQNDD